MRQVCILVEGQTEEAVVKTLLIDAAKARDIYLIPIIVRTSLTPAGVSRGGGSWKHYDRQLNDLLSQPYNRLLRVSLGSTRIRITRSAGRSAPAADRRGSQGALSRSTVPSPCGPS